MKEVKNKKTLLLMLLPAIIFFILFCYIPMIGVIIAFKTYTFNGGIFHSPWAGLENFKYLFMSGNAFVVTRNTLLYNLAFIIIDTTLQIFCAIILTELTSKVFKKITQSFIFFPYFISWVVVGAFVYNVFNYEFGSLNTLLNSSGMESIDVYSNPVVWIFIIIGFNAWKNLGYGTVLYIAAITSIESEMYEAAVIDGSSIFQRIFYITIPSIIPTVIILALLSIGHIFRGDFNMFYQLVGSNSMVYSTTDVIDTFVTRSLLGSAEIGMSAAAGFYQSILCFFIITIVNFLVKKYDPDYSLF